ncbi:MAG: Hpt domain-containing protein, partial [Halochromatium sp.]
MDELLQEFVNDAQEHLATIEQDLLAIEDEGASADKELINKVLRAAHSIKGGSGFFGLVHVKDLAHGAETVLDLMRSGKLIPNAEVINVLLAAFDSLRMMLEDPENSARVETAELMTSLSDLSGAPSPPMQHKTSLSEHQTFDSPLGPVTLSRIDVERAVQDRRSIYLVECDLVEDIEHKGQDIYSLFDSLSASSELLECTVDHAAVGTLEDAIEHHVPMQLVIATMLDKELISTLFHDLELHRIHLLLDPTAEDSDAQTTASEPEANPAPAASTPRSAPAAAPAPAEPASAAKSQPAPEAER